MLLLVSGFLFRSSIVESTGHPVLWPFHSPCYAVLCVLSTHWFVLYQRHLSECQEPDGGVSSRRKLLVLVSLAASLILITACLALVVKDFGWGATFAVPIIGIFWTVIVGFTTESGSVLLSTLLFVPCLILAYFLPEAYSELFGIFATSVYSYRISHIIAQRFLTTLVSSSYNAYNMLEEQIKITRIVAPK